LRLRRVDDHPIPIRSRTPAAIDTHLADGLGSVTIGCFADGEAPELLPDLPAQRLLAQIVQIQLVDDPPHLETELRVMVFAVEAVRSRHDSNPVEAELGVEGQQEVVVSG
jgi:hypothetical protein